MILFHGVPQERRLTATDISLLTVLLIFDIIERLRALQIKRKDGLATGGTEIYSLVELLDALGFRIAIVPKD